MCGIFGVLNLNKNQKVSYAKMTKCIDLQFHRGPDMQLVTLMTPYVGLAHARLSIIDLTNEANQPLDYLSLSIVFNGEIYNYVELREELIKEGYTFNTQSDTEVILAAYHFWGEECVTRFNGMWAFAIYDKEKDILFCSRDRFGIKPFYYTFFDGNFLFSSEIKSILEYSPKITQPNYDSILAFCTESVGAENEETWFKDILRLSPAHNLIIKKGGHQIDRYWDYPDHIEENITWDEALTTYKKLFLDSVKIRLRSDVPLGATMSGGLDSTSIVCSIDRIFGQRIDAYTASFNGGAIDEYDIVDRLKNNYNFNANKVVIEYDDFLQDLFKIIYLIESGHNAPAVYPLSKVNKKAKEKLTVILEGQGADELLGGYLNAVFINHLIDLLKELQIKSAIHELRQFNKQWSIKNAILMYGRFHLPLFARKFYRKLIGVDAIYAGKLLKARERGSKKPAIKYNHCDTRLTKILKEQHQLELLKLLQYGDAVSMMHSLESRLPFMDYRLVEYVFKLPGKFKIKNGLGKYIHRKAMEDILPDYIIYDKRKIGFDTPIEKTFIENKSIQDFLLNGDIFERNLFEKKQVQRLLDETISKKQDHSPLLFRLMTVEIWFNIFIDKKIKIEIEAYESAIKN